MNLSQRILLFLMPIILLYIFFSLQTKHIINVEKKYQNAVLFLGSSRVQMGINPSIISQCRKNKNIYNLGISSSTFKQNLILCDYLIRNSKIEKIYIELSPISEIGYENIVSTQSLFGLTFFDFFKFAKPRDYYLILKSKFFYILSLKDEFKEYFLKSKSTAFGYISTEENTFYTKSSFLTVNDLEKTYDFDITEHHNLILKLLKLAKSHNVQIGFFLPFTFRKDKERAIVISVYNSLSKSLKVPIDYQILNQISNPIYLKDNNHFNSKGALIYSKLFCENL